MPKKLIAAQLCVFMVLSGCAQFKRPPLMIKVPEFYDNKTKINELTLVADPYMESLKAKHFFSADLPKKGFLPVHFIAFNFGDQAYDLSETRFTLLRDDGAEIEPMNPKDVSRRVLHHTSLRMLGWGFAGLVILSIPFSMVAGIDSFRANQEVRRAVKENTLRVFEVGPHEAVDGFFFFELARGSRRIREALGHQYALVIHNLKEKETANTYEFRIGLN